MMLNHTLQANTTLIRQNCHHREHLSSILPGLRPIGSGPSYQSGGWKIKLFLFSVQMSFFHVIQEHVFCIKIGERVQAFCTAGSKDFQIQEYKIQNISYNKSMVLSRSEGTTFFVICRYFNRKRRDNI